MIDHLSLGVADLGRAGAFYDAVLAPLGYVRLWSRVDAIGYGKPGMRDEPFAIHAAGKHAKPPGSGWHLAFSASSRPAVDEFHSAAIRMGASDEGAPNLRPNYGPGYYAAFVRDIDGHKIEAVCHEA